MQLNIFSFCLSLKSGARVVAFDQHHAVLVVSKPSPNQLFPGFGVVKVSKMIYVLTLWTIICLNKYQVSILGSKQFALPMTLVVQVDNEGRDDIKEWEISIETTVLTCLQRIKENWPLNWNN